MTYAALIAALGLLCLEAYRRDLSGRKSHILYGGDDYAVHDVQERLGQVGYLMTGLGVYAALLPLWSVWWQALGATLPAAFGAYGSALWGGYWFQVRINRADDGPDVDPEEDDDWHSPRRGGPKSKGFWYGTNRRFQRPAAVACWALAAGLSAILYTQPW
jgi:hypothetical protein